MKKGEGEEKARACTCDWEGLVASHLCGPAFGKEDSLFHAIRPGGARAFALRL